MQLSLFSSSVLALATAAAPTFAALLAIRALEGIALAGVPAVAMTYLAEEIHPQSLGSSIGLYIGGHHRRRRRGDDGAAPLALLIAGVAVLTCGFFAAHSIASSWVGRRARSDRAQATALYLLAYYAGSSIAGPLAGAAWGAGGWTDVMTLAVTLLAVALLVSLRLRTMAPLRAAIPG